MFLFSCWVVAVCRRCVLYVYIGACIYACIYIWTCVFLLSCWVVAVWGRCFLYVYTYTCIYTCIHIYWGRYFLYVNMFSDVSMYAYIYEHIYIYICIYTYTCQSERVWVDWYLRWNLQSEFKSENQFLIFFFAGCCEDVKKQIWRWWKSCSRKIKPWIALLPWLRIRICEELLAQLSRNPPGMFRVVFVCVFIYSKFICVCVLALYRNTDASWRNTESSFIEILIYHMLHTGILMYHIHYVGILQEEDWYIICCIWEYCRYRVFSCTPKLVFGSVFFWWWAQLVMCS